MHKIQFKFQKSLSLYLGLRPRTQHELDLWTQLEDFRSSCPLIYVHPLIQFINTTLSKVTGMAARAGFEARPSGPKASTQPMCHYAPRILIGNCKKKLFNDLCATAA